MYERFASPFLPYVGPEPHKSSQAVDSIKVFRDLAQFLTRIDAKPDLEDARFSWFGLTDRGIAEQIWRLRTSVWNNTLYPETASRSTFLLDGSGCSRPNRASCAKMVASSFALDSYPYLRQTILIQNRDVEVAPRPALVSS